MVKVQKWLDDKYPTKKKTTKIDSEKGKLERESLEGELILKDFPNLEIVNLSIGKGITKITIEDCPKIYYINVNDNKISEIKGLEELKELQCLWVSYNMITDPDIILKNENLLIFACVRNPIKDRKINGKALNKLIYFSGGIGEEDRIYYSNEKDYVSKLKALANKLGIEDEKLEDKSASEVEESVNDKADTVKDENAKKQNHCR